MANLQIASLVSYVQTAVKNISGSTMFFSFLPKHGYKMTPAEVKIYPGDIERGMNDAFWTLRKSKAMQAAENSGLLRRTVNEHHVGYANVLSAIAISTGDLLWYNSGTDAVEPASLFTWAGNLAATQAAFKALFVGVAENNHLAGSGNALMPVQLAPSVEYEYTLITPAANVFGATYAPAQNGVATSLQNQMLAPAAAVDSVARCLRDNAVVGSLVLVNFQSAYWGANAAAQQ